MLLFFIQLVVYVLGAMFLYASMESKNAGFLLTVYLVIGLVLTCVSLYFGLVPLKECPSCSPDNNQQAIWIILLTCVAILACYNEGRPRRHP